MLTIWNFTQVQLTSIDLLWKPCQLVQKNCVIREINGCMDSY